MNIKKWHQEAADEAEEDALSLCDLPIYSDASEWEKFSACGSQSSCSVSSSKTEFFEFFSEEWNKPASSNLPPEKIIFCGKLIPHKDEEKCRRKNKQRRKSSRDAEPAESEASGPLWIRSRWFLFLFGMGGFPKEMDLKDIKNRQSRKTGSSPQTEYRGNRLRWMIRALSCGDSDGQVHAQAIVKASIGCIA